MDAAAVKHLINRWREDTGSTYQTWFLWEERIKNFRSIRRGIQAVVEEMGADDFGNVYKGSSLETVVRSIAEQRQIFKGATTPSCGSRNFGFLTSTRTARISSHSAAS